MRAQCCMPVITLTASYGAGGSVVGPAVARRLGLPFLDRAISAAVATELDVTVEEAEAGALRRSWLERMAWSMSPLTDPGGGGMVMTELADEQALRRTAEQVLREAARNSVDEPGRYDLQVDSTRLPLDTVTDLVVAAAVAVLP